MTKPKMGPEMIDEMAEAPTLDTLFDRYTDLMSTHPSRLTDDDFRQIVMIERGRRAQFINKD